MNNEQFTAAEFVRGVTWAPSMQSRVLIGGVPYEVGDMLADIADTSGHDYRDEIFGVLARVARSGDVAAQDLIRRMADTFVWKHCTPEPEPEEALYLKAEERGQFDHQTERLPRWIHLTA
jgi:hypothetical protein